MIPLGTSRAILLRDSCSKASFNCDSFPSIAFLDKAFSALETASTNFSSSTGFNK